MRLLGKWWCECKNGLVETEWFIDSNSLRVKGGELKGKQFLFEEIYSFLCFLVVREDS